MKTCKNYTYGEITEAEHQALRDAAHPCLTCGMLANVDPVLHATRYAHRPRYRDAEGTWEFWPRTMAWTRA